MKFAHEIVRLQHSRNLDRHGSGQFGAHRGHGTHQGLDIVAAPGAEIFSPIAGELTREALPYPNDPRYRGVLIRGTGAWAGFELKLFYLEGLFSGVVEPGMRIGHAQDLGKKYAGITNHIHLEARRHGVLVPPHELYGMCF